jgi:hypothetical protein
MLERDARDLRALAFVLDEDAYRVGVLEHVCAVAWRAVRVNRGGDGADRAQREVEQRPFQRRRAEDRERVALADPDREEPVRKLVDPFGGLGPRDLVPLAVPLDEIRGGAAVRGDRVLPEPRDRPRPRCRRRCGLGSHFIHSLIRGGKRPREANRLGPR